MSRQIILRFRDLITENDGTINDHQSLINDYGEVWWGWWMKQKEIPPRELYKEISKEIKEKGTVEAFLFNTGLDKFYKTKIKKILLAPADNTLGTPNPQISPTYYHRGSYPAWFLLNEIEQVNFEEYSFIYQSFPTLPDKTLYLDVINAKVKSLEELANQNVTLWVVEKMNANETITNY